MVHFVLETVLHNFDFLMEFYFQTPFLYKHVKQVERGREHNDTILCFIYVQWLYFTEIPSEFLYVLNWTSLTGDFLKPGTASHQGC